MVENEMILPVDSLKEDVFKDHVGLVSLKSIIRTAKERRPGASAAVRQQEGTEIKDGASARNVP